MDRTSAIVEAAQRVVDYAKGAEVVDFGVLKNGARADDIEALARALALPAPQWTRTPPSEPGCHYWARWISAAQGRTRRPFFVRVDSDGRLDPGFFADEIAEVEFWPIPVSPPPESP